MPSGQPYNSLGQILREGGEIALGLAIRYGWSEQKITQLFSRRFEPLRDSDRVELERIAREGVAAGDKITQLAEDALVELSDLPVNSQLFGDDPEGRRIRLIGKVDITGEGDWREIRLDLPGETSLSQLREMLIDESRQRSDDSPTGFGKINEDGATIGMVEIVFGERRF